MPTTKTTSKANNNNNNNVDNKSTSDQKPTATGTTQSSGAPARPGATRRYPSQAGSRVEGQEHVARGTCCNKNCDKERIIRYGKIQLTCGNGECYKKWSNDGAPKTNEPCRLCGSKDHHVLRCPHLTEENIKKLSDKHEDYEHRYRWWNGIQNILQARKEIFGEVKPQHIQRCNKTTCSYAHGIAMRGSIERPAYFDLGGEYDLMDDIHYDEIKQAIESGEMDNAKIISPQELGYAKRGVPVDLACSTSNQNSSIVWIDRWIRATIKVTTTSGRKFVLTQTNIGFVRRSSPLLILGKKTCTLCGYRTIRQQDNDR